MQIPATTAAAAGLSNTANAIQRGMARYDARAQQVVADSESLSPDAPATPDSSSSLPADLVGLQTDAISNRILFNVFRRQQEQLGEAADLIKPDRS